MITCDQIKIGSLVVGITVKSAVQAIIIPILAGLYTSMNFILMTTSIQFLIIFGGIYIYMVKKNGFVKPKKKRLIILSGLFTGLMAILMMYSANTQRTPVIMQAIIAGMPILPSVLLRKYFLDKVVVYNRILIGASLVFLISSIIISTIPLYSNGHFDPIQILWIAMYMLGVVCMSTYNMLQEKYINETSDNSIYNKVTIMFYSRCVEFIVLVSFSWLEYFIGFTTNPLKAFYDSIKLCGTDATAGLLLEGFVVAYLIAFTLGIELNTISTNYNMLIPIISNPLVIVFFTVFGSFNHGIHYPIWIVITCIISSTIGTILWVKGESNKTDYVHIPNSVN